MEDISNPDKKKLLIEALSYIQRFKDQIVVIKYGGAAMIQDDLKVHFARDIVLLQSLGMKPVIIHGGGHDVSKAMKKLGQEVSFVDGLRVTSSENVKVAEMVLSGTVNKEIISHINTFGGKAVGVSGKDGNLIRAMKQNHESGVDLGYVGKIVSTNPEILTTLLSSSFLPVISPIGMGEDGTTYNVNADTVAAYIAVALNARKIIFMTDVDGIKVDGVLQSELRSQQIEDYLENKSIYGGMVPKSHAALHCIQNGVVSAHIINGTDPHSVIAELFTDQGIGTKMTL